jgi:hypothetical protein
VHGQAHATRHKLNPPAKGNILFSGFIPDDALGNVGNGKLGLALTTSPIEAGIGRGFGPSAHRGDNLPVSVEKVRLAVTILKSPLIRNVQTTLFPARAGSAKEFIAGYLREHGQASKGEIAQAFQNAGRPINNLTLSSALSKSGGLFISNGSGVWRLAEPPMAKPA